jgi:GT2 family glycosyltransferase
MQKAINYAMTSFFTTGGIRGGKKKMDKFYPRSFNMGVRTSVYRKLEGFSAMRFGEDIDFSTRIFRNRFRCRLFPEAWVWHKRRTDLKKFFKQVHNSGIARIHLTKRHPGTLKIVHLLPAVFTLGCALLLLSAAILAISGVSLWWIFLFPFFLFALIIFMDASRAEKSVGVGLRAVAASFVQLTGYGSGFIRAYWDRMVLDKGEFEAFQKNFYQ